MFNRDLFAATLKAYLASHNNLSLREAGRRSGVSASTLSRIMTGEMPDIDSFGKLCAWIRQVPGTFFVVPEGHAPYPSPLAMAIYALSGDQCLPAEAREKLVDLVKVAYQCLANEGGRS
jgi:transcriptional regulator with XRE-family HTH domain